MEGFPIVRKEKVKCHLIFQIISDGVGGAVW